MLLLRLLVAPGLVAREQVCLDEGQARVEILQGYRVHVPFVLRGVRLRFFTIIERVVSYLGSPKYLVLDRSTWELPLARIAEQRIEKVEEGYRDWVEAVPLLQHQNLPDVTVGLALDGGRHLAPPALVSQVTLCDRN